MPLVYHSDTPGHGARLFPLSSALALGYFSARLLKSSASSALRFPGSWYLVRRSAPPLLGFFGALRVPCYVLPMLTARLLHSSTAPVLGLRSLPLDDLRRSAPSRTVPVLGRSSPRLPQSSTAPVHGCSVPQPLRSSAAPVLGRSGPRPHRRSGAQMSDTRRCRHDSRHPVKPFNAQPSWRTSVRSTWCSVILALGTSLRLEFSDAQLLRRSALPIFAI